MLNIANAKTYKSVAILKSSGMGLSITQDQNLAFKKIKGNIRQKREEGLPGQLLNLNVPIQ